jgi:hypothetical protein
MYQSLFFNSKRLYMFIIPHLLRSFEKVMSPFKIFITKYSCNSTSKDGYRHYCKGEESIALQWLTITNLIITSKVG